MTQFPPFDWRRQAACRGMDTDMFFPGCGRQGGMTKQQRTLMAQAKAICADCPVKTPCLEYALVHQLWKEDTGIWGGTTVRERKEIRRERAAQDGSTRRPNRSNSSNMFSERNT